MIEEGFVQLRRQRNILHLSPLLHVPQNTHSLKMPHLFYYSTPNVDLYCRNILPTFWLIFLGGRLKFCVKLCQQLDTPHIIFKIFQICLISWYSFQKLLPVTHQFQQQIKSVPRRACFLVWYLFTPKLKSYLQFICSQQLRNRSISEFFQSYKFADIAARNQHPIFCPLTVFQSSLTKNLYLNWTVL